MSLLYPPTKWSVNAFNEEQVGETITKVKITFRLTWIECVEEAGQHDVYAQEDDERIEVPRTPHHGKQLEYCPTKLIKLVFIQKG